jgi:chromosome segregation ATPase
MSDHLIAEADRHARALTTERDQIRTELALLREWQREVIQNANAHHAERREAIARAERAEAELKEWSLLNLWGGTPEIVHAFVKGQQARIHAAQDVEADLDATKERALTLADSLDRAQAELATERARLDWLEKRGPWESWFQHAKEVSILLRAPIREGIDAAMQEGAK